MSEKIKQKPREMSEEIKQKPRKMSEEMSRFVREISLRDISISLYSREICLSLSHIWGHCNTLQHNIVCLSTLQHTATHCNTLNTLNTHSTHKYTRTDKCLCVCVSVCLCDCVSVVCVCVQMCGCGVAKMSIVTRSLSHVFFWFIRVFVDPLFASFFLTHLPCHSTVWQAASRPDDNREHICNHHPRVQALARAWFARPSHTNGFFNFSWSFCVGFKTL